jgi:lipoyl(octanoyl) transferase
VEDERQCQYLDLGLVEYNDAYSLQRSVTAACASNTIPATLILLEHPPVLTLGRRADRGNLLFPPEVLRDRGIAVHQSTRGGDVTYHGPGQIVGYPILNLRRLRLGAAAYVHGLEDVLIEVVHSFDLEARTDPRYVGVWIGPAKVAAIGVAISGGVTMHGFALNVDPDLSHFQFINPCGITDREVTSLSRAASAPVPMAEVRRRLVDSFGRRFGVQMVRCSPEQLAAAGIEVPPGHEG